MLMLCMRVFITFSLTATALKSLDKPYEIITPMLLTEFVDREVFPIKLKIFIHAKETLVLELTKKETDQKRNDSQNGCQYVGTVNKNEKSRANLNLCGGITGSVITSRFSIFIRPKLIPKNSNISVDSLEVEHVLQSIVNQKKENRNTGLHGLRKPLRYRKDVKSDIRHAVKFLELYLVNDQSVYNFFNKNTSHIEKRCETIARLLDEKFRPLRVRIILVGIEIWTEKDLMQVTSNSHQTMWKFMRYRKTHINNRVRNDNAQLITKTSFDEGRTVGKAPIGTICYPAYSAGINQDFHSNPKYVANVIAHEIGHNLAMHHDDEVCHCLDHSNYKCIMSHQLDETVKSFSSCSKNQFEEHIESGHGSCLFDFPLNIKKPAVCGNGIIESGEECDCGSPGNCAKFGYCCHQITCKLFKNATCASGECCENCQFKARSTLCRYQRGECDLPEFCSGLQPTCPMDVHIQDTASCSSGKGYCISGVCLTHHHQCQDLFGNNSQSADGYCYKEFNTKGVEFGHCGKTTLGYKSCDSADAYCGKMQCELKMHTHKSANKIRWRTTGETMECVSKEYIDEYNHANDGDLSLAKDGTRCGHDNICVNRSCIALSKYRALNKITPCSDKCFGNGVCNNKHNCHCKPGWAPPYCNVIGLGGSINSEPLLAEFWHIRKPTNKMLYTVLGTTFGVILIVGVAVFVKVSHQLIKKHYKKKTQEQQQKYKEELKSLL